MHRTNRRKHIITLGGPPGSGKSTVRAILAKKFGYKTFSTGDFVRAMAIERGISLEELNEEVANDKHADELIDAELIRIENEEDKYVIDSHLAFHFVPSGFSVFLQISLPESARRIFNDHEAEIRQKSGDTMKTLEEAERRTLKRIENHKERYQKHYGIDPYVPSHYDLVIDSEHDTPEHIAEDIQKAYTQWLHEQ